MPVYPGARTDSLFRHAIPTDREWWHCGGKGCLSLALPPQQSRNPNYAVEP
jgi:hypothetical protein